METEQLISSFSSRINYSRRELKYYISGFQYRQLIKVIPNYMLLDENIKDIEKISYPVRSLYLESKDMMCYHERLDGAKDRCKYRYRTYDEGKNAEDASIFVEIKRKIDKDLHKRRTRFKVKELHKVLEEEEDWDFTSLEYMSPEETKTLNDFVYQKHKFKLSSFIGIRYEREAYYDKETRRLRLSFDRDMYTRTCSHIFGLYEGLGQWKKIPTRDIIFEIKTRSSLPQWIADLVKRFSLVAEPISKYCICIENLGLHKK